MVSTTFVNTFFNNSGLFIELFLVELQMEFIKGEKKSKVFW